MRSKIARWIGILLALALVAVGIAAWYKLSREVEQTALKGAPMEAWFKYGSIGNESNQGIPYWVWRVLPKIFPDYLPNGYDALGNPWEPGYDVPVGFSKQTVGFPRVAPNCAFCHVAQYRTQENESPTIVVPGPGNTVNPQGYASFLTQAANDDRFNSDNILEQIALIYRLSKIDKWFYRYLIIPATKKALITTGKQSAWIQARPTWGLGRVDPVNPFKFNNLHMKDDGTIGNSDIMPLWDIKIYEGDALHWDGLTTNLHESITASAIGVGMTYSATANKNLARIENWLQTGVHLPSSPYSADKSPDSPYYLDKQLITAGKKIYEDHCAQCHAPQGSRYRTVVALKEVGTDRHRLDEWTAETSKRVNNYRGSHSWYQLAFNSWNFEHFRKIWGYLAIPLDGLWLRGPYLHNGSVPTLWDILKKPQDRPKVFYRGIDLLDPVNVGFISQGNEAERIGFRYDTSLLGNSNRGHLFGTNLPEEQKRALLEYLKTL
ncbi:cytochrome C [Candidatus Nitrosoglobus terrae]|uniref:Cytochrome C n=1 Tax=Candidatus Nitrosoglobus terrae TaxID=1630141 RepID=A0A1Q2SMK7_9GAMM|nr:hypothetical protein [Candidatus Nitrosoglobus terrae]BAW80366.1 cytochrome C [Candidatus Nitrosoglobus terrae]